MNGLAGCVPHLAATLTSLKTVNDALIEQDKKISSLEAEAQHLARQNSELLDEMYELRSQRDALVKSHNEALAKIATYEALAGSLGGVS